jgi:hypothetical protein
MNNDTAQCVLITVMRVIPIVLYIIMKHKYKTNNSINNFIKVYSYSALSVTCLASSYVTP